MSRDESPESRMPQDPAESPESPESQDSPDEPDAPSKPGVEAEPEGTSEPDWVRRRRLAAVFGDVLPDSTSDDRTPGSAGGGRDEGKGDDWYRDQVPPHHG